jgi:hypothetical protein
LTGIWSEEAKFVNLCFSLNTCCIPTINKRMMADCEVFTEVVWKGYMFWDINVV